MLHMNHVLTLPALNHSQALECTYDILGPDRSLFRNVCHAQIFLGICVRQEVHQNICPVTSVGDFAQVTQRLFGGSYLIFALGQFVG